MQARESFSRWPEINKMGKTLQSMSRKRKRSIALLHVLHQMTPGNRQIILDHLNSEAVNAVIGCLLCVLKNKNKVGQSTTLTSCISSHSKHIGRLLSSKASDKTKKRKLAQFGGNPLGLIISAAIPLLMSLWKK